MSSVRNDRAVVALLGGFVALAVVLAAALWFNAQQDTAAGRVRHTLEVQNRLSHVQTQVLEAEAAQRGYLLTDGSSFLDTYRTAVGALRKDLDRLCGLAADNPRQRANCRRLRAAVVERAALLDENLSLHAEGRTVPVERLQHGRELMDATRLVLADMRAEEERLLAERTLRADRDSLMARVTLVAGGLAMLMLGVFAVADARRRLTAAIQTNAALQAEAASREAAEAQVRQFQKNEAIGQLTGGIAHDFNNMLAIIIGSLDLAKRRLHSDRARAEACIDSALEGATRAAQLTARLLAFSRQQPLNPVVLDVNKLVGGMSELLRRTIGEDIRVETVLAGGLWRTLIDAAQLENAIVNLCVNARDAMPDGGRLTLETSNAHLDDAYAAAHAEVAPGQYVMISVTDTGTGMPPEVVERAFDPFYTTKGPGRGTGLGLSQVEGFVKQSRGHVKIYSEPGVGTTIKIYLPRSLKEAAQAEALTPPAGELPRGRTDEIVLVVEDDERVRHLSVDALRELGYTVVQASDAAQALAVLTMQPRVDLLFTDVVMPDLNGRRLAEKARETRPDLKVLYTTGYTKNAIVHNGMLDADVAFIAKPFTIEQLALKVRQVLDAPVRTEPAD
ncbi:MAG: CHASE3 domain-containing protein [Phenylobacterium sp.]|uniref:CHASE3 domain-containing protein n=1 Tax=Phenylobacterium sp. TaxID=1871053 RepID=UPI001A39C369|nr:CHASE3 domain-containing protein [Phenylobacterium sp.]MBL8771118.1 CHASE3 domain-containing protein [Phenylobacterium sp.]